MVKCSLLGCNKKLKKETAVQYADLYFHPECYEIFKKLKGGIYE